MTCNVHHVPGRVRFKIPGLRDDLSLLGGLPEALSAHEGVERIEVRAASNSLIVHYDPQRVRCHHLADTVNRKLSIKNARAVCREAGEGGSLTPQEQMARSRDFVRGSVRHVGIVFGQAAFKVALEQAVRGGLNTLFRGSLGRI